MNEKTHSTAYRVALGGVSSSLALVIMVMTGVMPAFYIILPMICGLLIKIIAMEISVPWATLTYIAVSFLSIFINPNIEGTLIFILFFGIYPVLQVFFDKIKNDYFRIPLKLIFFAAIAITDYQITVFILGVEESLDNMPQFLWWVSAYWKQVFICLFVFFFSYYDAAITYFGNIYHKKLRRKFFKT